MVKIFGYIVSWKAPRHTMTVRTFAIRMLFMYSARKKQNKWQCGILSVTS